MYNNCHNLQFGKTIRAAGLGATFLLALVAARAEVGIEVVVGNFQKYSKGEVKLVEIVSVLVAGQMDDSGFEYNKPKSLALMPGFDDLNLSEQQELLWVSAQHVYNFISEAQSKYHWKFEHVRSWKYMHAELCHQWLEWARGHAEHITTNNLQNRFSRMVDFRGDALLGCRCNIESVRHYEEYAKTPTPGSVLADWFAKWGNALTGKYGSCNNALAILYSMYERDEQGNPSKKVVGAGFKFAAGKVERWKKFRAALVAYLASGANGGNETLKIQLDATSAALDQVDE